MHYDGTAFAIDRHYTMLDLATGRPVQRNEEISEQDFELLNKIYPGGDVDVREKSVLVLNSEYGWNPAVLIDSKGNNEELTCFERDSKTEAYGSCSINWQNQMIVFGGFHEMSQISRLDGYKLKRIGNLDFDHSAGACSVMNGEIFLCFDHYSR